MRIAPDHLEVAKRKRYGRSMVGGLKLKLEPTNRDDRRGRFAQIVLEDGSGEAMPLATDARGRLQYRLPQGRYRVRVLAGEETRFVVKDRGWTTVRLALA